MLIIWIRDKYGLRIKEVGNSFLVMIGYLGDIIIVIFFVKLW